MFPHVTYILNTVDDYIKNGDVLTKEFGEVMTPLSLVNTMLDLLPPEVWSNASLKWLDPAAGCGVFFSVVLERLMNGLATQIPNDEDRYVHIVENMLYAAEIQPIKVDMYTRLFGRNGKNRTNIYANSFVDGAFDFHRICDWGVDVFDIAVGNPPYLRALHIEFLEKCADVAGKVLFVHPGSWIFRKESLLSFKKTRLSSACIINGNYYFPTADFVAPLCISYTDEELRETIQLSYDMTGNSYDVPLKNIPTGLWEPTPIMYELKRFYENLTKTSCLFDRLTSDKCEFEITIPRVCGHATRSDRHRLVSDDFFTFFYRKSNLSIEENNKKSLRCFSSDEKYNLTEMMKGRFMRFGLYLNKISFNMHTESYLTHVPVPPTDRVYSDAELFELYKFSEQHIHFIETVIPDYYNS